MEKKFDFLATDINMVIKLVNEFSRFGEKL